MRKKIAIIDVIGLTYDPTTLEKYGLGGSESAIIYIARELAKLNFDVTVFNNCVDSRASEGVYDGVTYLDLRRLHVPNDYTCDIMVASRTVMPFLPEHLWGHFNYPYPTQIFTQLQNSASLKVLWLHDTFCSGDYLVEELVMNNHIHEIFTLSDFHTAYISNCDHGRKRNFEVLKNKMFMTRNGARKYIDEVDIQRKDKNLFIYNASITKGMIPLVNDIWPRVKQQLPEAKLRIVGGYYRFRDGAPPDAQEEMFHQMVQRQDLRDLDVTFLGVIPQREIANHLAESSYMIFPGAFPETFGISTLESLLYNTPLLTTRFGALEETAVEMTSYKIDYAIEPNTLFTDINKEQQVQKFVNMVVQAYHNPYLHAQKMQACNMVHDVAGWDTVALQWKQHFYHKLGLHLPVDEYREVRYINNRLHQIYGRRFSNPEEWGYTSTYPQRRINVVSPFYNAEQYIAKCILSVASQDYGNYKHYLIDDASTDNSYNVAMETIASLPENIRENFILLRNTSNEGAVYNQVTAIRSCEDDSIIMLLDGDDSLVNNNTIFQMYNTLYSQGTEFTYGSCWSLADNIPLIAQEYPRTIRETKQFRQYKFAWNMPYTHLRTFIKHLINDVPNTSFQDASQRWYRAGGDTSIFYNLIEHVSSPDAIRVVKDVVYLYNDLNPLNDYKVNSEQQTQTAQAVLHS